MLIVKFAEAVDMMTCRNYEKIAEAGILIGLRRYRFFGTCTFVATKYCCIDLSCII